MLNELLQQLTAETWVLTANRRQASYYAALYDQQQQQSGATLWHKPNILPFVSWLNYCWQKYQDIAQEYQQTLLTPTQELFLWQKVISQSEQGDNLLNARGAAKQAQAAWQSLQQWQLQINPNHFAEQPDSQAFATWASQYQCQLKSNNYIEFNALANIVQAAFGNNKLPLPKHLLIAGFDELPPQYQSLLNQLAKLEVKVDYLDLGQQPSQVSVIGLGSTEDELFAMARYCRATLLANPELQIGCVIDQLNDNRDQVYYAFEQVFTQQDSDQLSQYQQLYNISSGQPLSEQPLIYTALLILALHQNNISLAKLGSLLRSPYLGDAEDELLSRAQFDAKLRELGELSFELSQVKYHSQNYCRCFSQMLDDYLALLYTFPEKASPRQWADHFMQLLSSMGWPGQRELNSIEYQQLQTYYKVLDQFIALNSIHAHLNFSQAKLLLQQLASETLFQAQSKPAPIQILGTLEAAGLQFDRLWVMGLHDAVWPMPAKPNPFIPISLQRQHHMPHADAKRELHYCQQLTKRFAKAGNQVIFSYPKQEQDRELRKSRLLADYPEIEAAELALSPYTTINCLIQVSGDLEQVIDDQAPPLKQMDQLHGGTALLKYQAACPFKAFASFRLGASGLESPSPGLAAFERGSLLHQILHQVWQTLGDQQQLFILDENELRTLLLESIDQALLHLKKYRPSLRGQRFQAIERQRLLDLLLAWLHYEKQRPFFKVIATEQSGQTTIGSLSLKIQVDRIDQLADGRQLIVDYKTGNPSINDWLGERPNDPQLPIYCITDKAKYQGLLFAKINTTGLAYKGIADSETEIDGVVPIAKLKQEQFETDWQSQQTAWQQVLTELAQQFHEGKAQVDPKEGAKTCQFCELHPLCRIAEAE